MAYNCDEVLEQVCLFLGTTAVADGDTVYFLDYDAIKSGNNDYCCFTVGNTSNYSIITRQHTKQIKASDYSENGATLSLDDVYNKVTVTDKLNTYDNITTNIWDFAKNITATDPTLKAKSDSGANKSYDEVITNDGDDNMLLFVD